MLGGVEQVRANFAREVDAWCRADVLP